MKRKTMPWDRPSGSFFRNRQGDRADVPIFTALGRALSAWEGVNAAVNSLAHALHRHLPEFEAKKAIDQFEKLLKTHDRAAFLRNAGEDFLTGDFRGQHSAVAKFKKDLRKETAAYAEWAARRNELAHGYVTEARCPDYDDPDQPLITVYALLPSHARVDRWFNAEPEWNYLAVEIERFAQGFQDLDNRLERLAANAGELQLGRSLQNVIDSDC
ncbi:hypothetical protein [Rhizobium sp. SL86]|uniref:hypothetical protein n=1 Tax=Rhizobium sp. SL86 TaxID=2995148 RepID=UPI002273CBF1|nr:hypothetical protein [Rhizobium sp. SL86]MCY1664252.1 hypothetical protein [Rhizobium sp. SL86]